MRAILSAVMALGWVALAQGQESPIKLPTEIKSSPGKLISVKAETLGKKVVWDVSQGLDWKTCDTGKELLATGPPGRYSILAITSIDDMPHYAKSVVVIDGTSPGPTPPIPPMPNPPLPIPPPTPPPIPVDPLVTDLQRLFDMDATAEKRERLPKLIELYKLGQVEAKDASNLTSGSLIEELRKASLLLVKDSLRDIRSRLGNDLGVIFPANVPLTEESRLAAAALFGRYVSALEKVK